jgi:hypothetical protein
MQVKARGGLPFFPGLVSLVAVPMRHRVETTTVNDPTGLRADARLAPDGTTLWVADSGANTASGFALDGRVVVEPPNSTTAGPARVQLIGTVVTPNRLFGATPTT